MRRFFLMIAVFMTGVFVSGCSRRIDGPRFWWDDRSQERLSDSYRLPDDPGAPADFVGFEKERALASGEDLSEDSLRDYHSNLDQEEERRKSGSSLVDF